MRTKILSMLLALVLLSGCAAPTEVAPAETSVTEVSTAESSDAPITLRFTQWIPVDSPRGEVFTEIANAYTTLHPNVNIQFDFIPFDSYPTTLPLRLSGSNPPDAGWLTENAASTWLDSGILVDMGSSLTADSEYDYADLSSAGMELWLKNDSAHGVPFSTSPFLLVYNRDLFEAAGVDAPDAMIQNDTYTWENLAVALKAIKDETGVVGLQSVNGGLYTGERIWHTLTPIIRAYGGDAWDTAYQCKMSSPETIAALTQFHKMIFTDGTVEQPGQVVDFNSGGVAVTMGQLSRVGTLTDVAFKWDIAPLPAGPAGTVDVIGQAAFVVFTPSPNRETAIDFVKFLTNEENTLKLAQFFPPIRASVLETDVLLTANPAIATESMRTAVIAPTLNGRVLPTHPNFPTIDLTARPFFDTLWNADADVAATLTQMCEAIQPLLTP